MNSRYITSQIFIDRFVCNDAAQCLIRPIASDTIYGFFADVAQLVEQRIRNAWVSGSNPLIGSINSKTYGRMDAHQVALFSSC